MLARSYLLLQPYYARPLLLEQPLILFPRGLVEIVRDVGFFAERLSGFGRINDAQISDNGLVPGMLSAVGFCAVAMGSTHNSSAWRSVSIALMAKRLAHTRGSQKPTIYRDAG